MYKYIQRTQALFSPNTSPVANASTPFTRVQVNEPKATGSDRNSKRCKRHFERQLWISLYTLVWFKGCGSWLIDATRCASNKTRSKSLECALACCAGASQAGWSKSLLIETWLEQRMLWQAKHKRHVISEIQSQSAIVLARLYLTMEIIINRGGGHQWVQLPRASVP